VGVPAPAGRGGGTTTIESKPDFLRAMREGHVEVIARPLHTGRSTIVIETDLRDAEGATRSADDADAGRAHGLTEPAESAVTL
jgi:uncharacterized protein (TIGR00369 family)